MDIADHLRKAIKDSDQSLMAIARAAGVHQPSLTKFMQGLDIRLKTAQALADYFGFKITPPAAPAVATKKPRRK